MLQNNYILFTIINKNQIDKNKSNEKNKFLKNFIFDQSGCWCLIIQSYAKFYKYIIYILFNFTIPNICIQHGN